MRKLFCWFIVFATMAACTVLVMFNYVWILIQSVALLRSMEDFKKAIRLNNELFVGNVHEVADGLNGLVKQIKQFDD